MDIVGEMTALDVVSCWLMEGTFFNFQKNAHLLNFFMTYRRLYAPAFNPITNKEEESNVSFQDFIHLVIEGPVELSKFFDENNVK